MAGPVRADARVVLLFLFLLLNYFYFYFYQAEKEHTPLDAAGGETVWEGEQQQHRSDRIVEATVQQL